MKKISIALLAFALVAGFGVSTACAEKYVSGNLAMVIANDSTMDDGVDTAVVTADNGFGITGAFGGTLGNGARLEAELGYRSNDVKDLTAFGITVPIEGDVSSVSFMGNAYYDFATSSSFSPFIGGGIGFANVEVNDTATTEDDTVFAYQLAAGVGFAINEKLTLDLQYRYFATSDLELTGVTFEYATQNLMAGLRYSF